MHWSKIGNLNIRGFRYLQRSWKQSPVDTKGQRSFWGVTVIHGFFFTVQGSAPLNPTLFKGQLYSDSIPGEDLCATTESSYLTNH